MRSRAVASLATGLEERRTAGNMLMRNFWSELEAELRWQGALIFNEDDRVGAVLERARTSLQVAEDQACGFATFVRLLMRRLDQLGEGEGERVVKEAAPYIRAQKLVRTLERRGASNRPSSDTQAKIQESASRVRSDVESLKMILPLTPTYEYDNYAVTTRRKLEAISLLMGLYEPHTVLPEEAEESESATDPKTDATGNGKDSQA